MKNNTASTSWGRAFLFGKIIKIVLTISVILLVGLVLFVGCSKKQKEKFFNAYGKEKAYVTVTNPNDSNDKRPLRAGNSTIEYFLDSSLDADAVKYRSVAEAALNELNKFSAFTVRTSNNSGSAYCITSDHKTGNANAENNFNYVFLNNDSCAKIITSTITYHKAQMKDFSDSGKKHIAIHELGHTLGLVDRTEGDLQKNSVMYYAYGKNAPATFTSYSEFDVANVKWAYGGSY